MGIEDEYRTIQQIADDCDVSHSAVYKALKVGKFPGKVLVGKNWMVPVKEAIAYHDEHLMRVMIKEANRIGSEGTDNG